MSEHRLQWLEIADDEVVEPGLTRGERDLLADGVGQWAGPARPNDAVAVLIGFSDLAEFNAQSQRLCDALRAGHELSKRDWARALVALELVWASKYYGAALDWHPVTGKTDEETLRTLRSLQHKLLGLRAPRID